MVHAKKKHESKMADSEKEAHVVKKGMKAEKKHERKEMNKRK